MTPEITSQIRDTFEKALIWAAKKCEHPGARGHIPGAQWSWQITKSSLNKTQDVDELKVENLKGKTCMVCNSELTSLLQDNIDTLVYRRNVLELPKKVENAWKNRNRSDWESLSELRGEGYTIGTGGSYVVAHYFSLLLSFHLNNLVVPIYPFDYNRIGINTKWVLFISSSGSTPDILSSYRHSGELEVDKKIFITRFDQDVLKSLQNLPAPKILTTNIDGEKGFLSVSGILIPCFLAYSAFIEAIWNDDNGYSFFLRMYSRTLERINSIFGKLESRLPKKFKGHNILILGGGFAWPATLNLESKMTESGIGNPEISEMKNYSHGRFMSSIDKSKTDQINLIIICGMPDDKPYRDYLLERLPKEIPICELVSEGTGPEGGLELMLMSEQLMRLISEREGVDISKQEVPKKGLELYKYKYADILSFKDRESKI